MDKSESQKELKNQIINENPDDLSVAISDSGLTIRMEAGGHDAAYTAEEARELAQGILLSYHQRGWGRNIVPTADYICDLSDVVDNKMSAEDVEQKWDHDGVVGDGQQYTIVSDTGSKSILSFNSKVEAMRFCEEWNSRSSWLIEYHLENDGEREAIWNLTKSEGAMVAERLQEEIQRLICSEETPDWEIAVSYKSEIPSENGPERIFCVEVRNPNQQNGRYGYQIYYAIDGEGINTFTNRAITHVERVRIDRQRGRVLEAMSKIPKRLGLYIGDPGADLEFINFDSALSPDSDFL